MARMDRTDIIITRAGKELEPPAKTKEQIDSEIAEYLASGGEIEQIPNAEVEPDSYSPVSWGSQTQVIQ